MRPTRMWNAILAALMVTGSHAWADSAKGLFTEFPTPSAASLPQGVDVASNGDVWFSETNAGKVAVLRADLTTREFPVPNGGQPIITKVAADGIWFTDGPGHAIGHLNPATEQITEYAIPSGSSPLFLQIGRDGSKWFSKTTGVGRLSLDGSFSEWDVTLEHPDDNIEQISLDVFGNLWFVERNFDGAGAAGTNKVRRLNPQTNVISTYLVPTFGGNPAGVQANPNGTIWVAEYFANALALLNPLVAPHTDEVVLPSLGPAMTGSEVVMPVTGSRETGTNSTEPAGSQFVKPAVTPGWVEFHIPTANAQAEDMRLDRDGRVWFEEDSGKIGVLNPFIGLFTEFPMPSPNSGYFNIALDPEQEHLWFTEAGIFAPVSTKIGVLRIE